MSLASSSLVGTTIADRYLIEDEIGSGALGKVYKAKHQILDRHVAVKVLFEDVKGNENAYLRFQREAQTACALSHPNIVTVYDFGLQDNSFPFLVMDYLQGDDLKTVIKRDGRLPLPRALPILLQIADALAHAHSHGVLHRDIKPDNIILINNGPTRDFVKIVDFGIAKRLGPETKKLTMDGQVVGTPAYMSPEQILNSTNLDARSDIYTFGILIFNMVTGALPIQGKTSVDTMAGHISMEPLSLIAACPGANFPASLQSILTKTLKKYPEDRQQSMDELKNELEWLYKAYK